MWPKWLHKFRQPLPNFLPHSLTSRANCPFTFMKPVLTTFGHPLVHECSFEFDPGVPEVPLSGTRKRGKSCDKSHPKNFMPMCPRESEAINDIIGHPDLDSLGELAPRVLLREVKSPRKWEECVRGVYCGFLGSNQSLLDVLVSETASDDDKESLHYCPEYR